MITETTNPFALNNQLNRLIGDLILYTIKDNLNLFTEFYLNHNCIDSLNVSREIENNNGFLYNNSDYDLRFLDN